MKTSFAPRTIATFAFAAMASVAAASLFVHVTPASAAGLLVADGGQGGKLEIESQDVRVTINNSIAVTQIVRSTWSCSATG